MLRSSSSSLVTETKYLTTASRKDRSILSSVRAFCPWSASSLASDKEHNQGGGAWPRKVAHLAAAKRGREECSKGPKFLPFNSFSQITHPPPPGNAWHSPAASHTPAHILNSFISWYSQFYITVSRLRWHRKAVERHISMGPSHMSVVSLFHREAITDLSSLPHCRLPGSSYQLLAGVQSLNR